MTTPSLLINNGTVVDGTGNPPFSADVRLRGGLIYKVAADPEPI